MEYQEFDYEMLSGGISISDASYFDKSDSSISNQSAFLDPKKVQVSTSSLLD